MPLNLKNPNAISGQALDENLNSLVRDWGPTLNRWALKIENRLDQAHQVANESKDFTKKSISNIVFPTTTTVTDGLTHGDAVWEYDPAFILERDDFLSIGASATAAEAAALPSSFTSGSGAGWNFVSASFASDPPYWVPGGPMPNLGLLGVPNNSTSGQASFLLRGPFSPHGMPLLDYPGWKMTWVFQISRVRNFPNGGVPTPTFSMNQTSMYVGLGNWTTLTTGAFPNTTSPRPPFFLGLRFDTDTTAPAISDTFFNFEYVNQGIAASYSRSNTQGTTISTGIAPQAQEGLWYRFEMSCPQSGQVKMSLSNGTTTFSSTLAISPIVTISTGPSSVSINGTAVRMAWGTNLLPVAQGTKLTIDYSNGTTVAFNGTFTQFDSSTNAGQLLDFFGNGSVVNAAHSTLTFYPSYVPIFVFGNDSQAAPTGWNKGVFIDYYSFVWNPNLSSTAPGTPNSLKSRYF